MDQSEEVLATTLLDAQIKAGALFAEIAVQNLIRRGTSESEINENIYALAGRMYGITRYWHKRIVRAGRNTLAPYDENPPDLTVGEDDIVFLDFGPVFEEWEADFGRTYVVGNDPLKHKLCRDIEHLPTASSIFTNILRSLRPSFMRMRNTWRSELAGSTAAQLQDI